MICYSLCLKKSINVNINIKHTSNKYPAVLFLLSLYGTIIIHVRASPTTPCAPPTIYRVKNVFHLDSDFSYYNVTNF